MAFRWPNWLRKTFQWLVRLLTLQMFWKKPGSPESMQLLRTDHRFSPAGGEYSIELTIDSTKKQVFIQSLFSSRLVVQSEEETEGTSPSAPMTVIHGYETTPTDPMKTATGYASIMNRDLNHCENFYDFVCNKFPGANPIPPWYNAIAASDERVHEINEKILVFLETDRLQGPPIFQNIRKFFADCMNEGLIERYGLQTIFGELNLVGLSPDPTVALKAGWGYKYIEKLARIHRYTPFVEFLFDVSVQVDPLRMANNHIFIGNTPSMTHAGVNLETEGLYSFAKFSNVYNAKTTTEPDGQRYQVVRMALTTYITKVVNYMDTQTQIAGKEKFSSQFFTETIAKVVEFLLNLEKTRQVGKYNRVEKILRTRVSKMQDEVNLMDRTGYVGITWIKYFEVLFENLPIYDPKSKYFTKNDPVVLVQNLSQFRETLRLFHHTEKDTFVLALWFVVVHSLAPLGPKILRDYRNEYISAVYGVGPTPRKLTCLNLVRTHFGYFVGHILAQDKRSDHEQMKIIEMVSNIKSSLIDAIQESTWMDPATKAGARTKLGSVTPYISVWDTLKDPNKIQQFYGNSFKIEAFFAVTYANMLRQRRTEMLKSFFYKNDFQNKPYPNPASIYSRYYPSFVHLTVPMGALGPPFYDLGMEAFNYGALGVLITRELWRAVDASGRYYDQHGDGYPWWTPPTSAEYEKREASLIKYYGSIRLQILGINVDGVHTALQNVADLVGFEVGLRAYRKHTQMHGPEKTLEIFKDYDPEKLFTIAFANMHCIHSTLEYIYGQATEDEYPPQAVRVNGVIMHSKEFARIWNCPPKQTIIL